MELNLPRAHHPGLSKVCSVQAELAFGDEPTPTPSTVIDDFICIRDGIFPDMDCTKYHVCENKTSTVMSCKPGEHFDGSTQTCSSTAACGSFDCSQSPEGKVAHSLFPQFYTLCPLPEEPLVVTACPQGYQIVQGSQDCQPSCVEEGVMEDLSDCHFYIQCILEESRMVMKRVRCPDGQAFNPGSSICSDEQLVENCNKF